MRIVYTDRALRDLDEILTSIETDFPSANQGFVARLRSIERQIGRWPDSAQEVAGRTGIRTVPFVRYPYRLFYRVRDETVQIVAIHHTSRNGP